MTHTFFSQVGVVCTGQNTRVTKLFKNKTGPKIEPCGTPVLICMRDDWNPSISVYCIRL